MRGCLLVLLLIAYGACGSAAGGEGTVRSGPWELRFDDATGDWKALTWHGKPLLARNAATPAVDVRTGGGRWLQMEQGVRPRLVDTSWDEGSGTLILTRRTGDWTLAETVCFGAAGNPNRVSRDLRLTWQPDGEAGTEPAKLRGAMFSAALPKEGRYLIPTQVVQPNGRGNCADIPLGQAANTSYPGWPTPPVWPLLIERDDGLALLCINDMRRDTGSTMIWSEGNRLRLVHDFNAEGWAERGVAQTVGTAYIEVVEAPLDEALRHAVWQWYDDVGLRVPASRPDWVRDAVLYSFHPGGTIGSGFTDLGGFTAARENLLPIIERLGIGAVWTLPIEDQGCYWPRDYYRFQPGLGTPEEYRALVDAAHDAGIRFWQDNVPHGGTPAFGQVRGNKPWWLVFDEKGDAQSYWCWDFGEPHWQAYIAGVAGYYTREFGVDGFRIDACGGNRITNWRRAGFPTRDRTPANVPEDYWRESLDATGGEVPPLPYEHGSLGRRQGGMEMIHAIREAVRKNQPKTGAVLAEVQGSPYMQEGDVVYDFALAHGIFPHLRKMDPAEGVPLLRQLLEEQKFAEPRGTLRLRYTESHDTVRAAGLYGIAAARALRALTLWIDGMPMIYHDSDRGEGPFLKRAIAVRQALPELRRGDAGYLAVGVDAPQVFACLRATDHEASVVLVNVSAQPTDVRCTVAADKLPAALRTDAAIWEAMTGRSAGPLGEDGGSRGFSCSLRPWGATVLAIRPQESPAPLPAAAEQETAPPAAPASGIPRVETSDGSTVVKTASYVMELDRATGLVKSFRSPDGAVLLDAADIFLGVPREAGEPQPDGPQITRNADQDAVDLRWDVDLQGGGSVTLLYACRPDGVRLTATLTGDVSGDRAGLIFRAPSAYRYQIRTAEGLFDEWFSPRHGAGRPGDGGGIYYRPQGDAIIWQSRLQPSDPSEPRIRVADADGHAVDIEAIDLLADAPANVEALEAFGGQEGWHAAFLWRDLPHSPLPAPHGTRQIRLELRPSRSAVPLAESWQPVDCGGPRLSHTSLNWVVENDHYRVALRRTGGVIAGLWEKGTSPRRIMEDCDVYTDAGLNRPDAKWMGASGDGETAAQVWQDGDVLRIRFQGRLRGEERFSMSDPPVWFVNEYAFDGSPTFRVNRSVLCEGQVRGGSAFLSWLGRLPEAAQFSLLHGGEELVSAAFSADGRTGQSAKLPGSPVPDAAVIRDAASRTLVSLGDMAWHGPQPPHNIFADGHNFFVAWLDTFDREVTTGRWYQMSMTVTSGDERPAEGPSIAWLPDSAAWGASAFDGGFEMVGAQAVRISTGERVHLPGETPRTDWQVPAGGSFDPTVSHSGVQSAKVVDTTGDYALFQHDLPLSQYPPGTHVRLTSWLKGQDVVRGDVDWKAAMAGFAFELPDGSWQYSIAQYGDGTFDWREFAADATVPENAVAARVRVGINGGRGTLWIDDVSVQRLP